VSPSDPDSTTAPARSSFATKLFGRQLAHYPDTGPRYFYLGVVVLATIVQYYDLYITYAVSTAAIAHYDMTFTFFVYLGVVGGVVGAFASLVAGLADRWGRANLVVGGLLVVGVLVAFVMPSAPNKWAFLTEFAVVSVVEGMVLVATPALTRDFSPQLGRASAMGFWTMGPVLGSVVVTEVTAHTFSGSTTFQDEIRWAGYAGLAVFVVALVGLKELAPALRDQLMVSLRDRALIEAKAEGLDTEAAATGHWRQMMRLDVIGSAFAISIYLLVYFAAVGFFVVYFATTFGYTPARANAVATWYWVSNAIALVFVGIASDLLKVRKPFMVLGAVGSIVVISVFATKATQPTTGYYTFAWLCAGIGAFTGITYAPWMAGFTETVEKHNPAATATGLAVWGWIIRIVVAGSGMVLPLVVTSATPLVDHGPAVAAAAARPAGIVAQHPAIFQQLAQFPNPADIPPALLGQAVAEVGLSNLQAVQTASTTPQFTADLAVLTQYGTEVQKAQKTNPAEWKRWWFVCVGAQVVFLPFIFVMTGRWSPKKAKEDADEHRQRVDAELAELQASTA
jgi:MFS family permease